MITNKELLFITHLFRWVITQFPYDKQSHYSLLTASWFALIDKWIKNEGLASTISRVKSMRLHVTRFLAGSPLKVSDGFKLDKRGLPSALGPGLKKLISGDQHDKRFLFSLLTITRCFTLPGKPNFESITSPSKRQVTDSLIEEVASQVSTFCPHLIPYEFERYHITTKAGPNGLALDFAIQDLKILEDHREMMNAISLLGGLNLTNKITSLKDALRETQLRPLTKPKGDSNLLRRLSIKQDKEGKTRLFAILDYWSQTSLFRLHNELNSLLRSIEMDCTFDQTSRLTRLVPNERYYSFDLKDATDRFPLSIQKAVLSRLTSPEIAEAWRTIMVGLPFHYGKETYSYEVGQPMGAYSSWPLFALSHHCVVQAAAKRAGWTSTYSNYMLLGDDIVIADDLVAKNYEFIMQELDVSISAQKTHVSKNMFEFAKRWMYKNTSISGISLVGLTKYNGPETILAFLSSIKRTWEDYDKDLSRSQISDLLLTIRQHKVQKLNLRLEALRIWESLQLPLGVNFDRHENDEKVWKAFNEFFRKYTSCNRVKRDVILEALDSVVGHVKIELLKKMMVETSKNVDAYYKKLIIGVRRSPTFNQELLQELPRFVQTLPVIEISKFYIAKLHEVSQDLRKKLNTPGAEGLKAYDIRSLKASGVPTLTGFNPLTLLQKDANELEFVFHSQLAKAIKKFMKENEKKVRQLYDEPVDPTSQGDLNQGDTSAA